MKFSYYIFESDSFDPCRNLAIEEYLLSKTENAVILYLWQNQNTVVIGKNQNPWIECRTALLQQEGGTLVRRLSGGGAVFHDLGNLNFTFLVPRNCFDETKQFCVILDALAALGIDAEFTGRNDMTANGRKFSGNAYYKNSRTAYHHGTLLVDADLEKLGRYLSPSKAKLQSKGVDSVRSRVVNLKELNPEITVASLKAALIHAFAFLYRPPERLILTKEDEEIIDSLTEKYRSWDWTFGRKIPFTLSAEERFPWGSIRLELAADKGIITDVRVFSDAMDDTVAPRLEEALRNQMLAKESVHRAIDASVPEFSADLQMLMDAII